MSNNFGLTFTGRIRSFKCAIKGIWVMISSQHNAWIHAAATVVVVAVGFYFRLTRSEWIILAVISVWMAQALNTAFEFLTDVASPEFHPLAEKAKDVAAGAVLIAAIGSVIIGLIVLGPHALAKRQMAVSVALWVVGGCAGRPAPVVDLPQRISESFGSEAKYPTARGRRPMPAKFVGDDETLIRSSEPVSSPMIIGEAERCQFKLKKPLCMPASADTTPLLPLLMICCSV